MITNPQQYLWQLDDEDLGLIRPDGYFNAGPYEGTCELRVLDTTIQGNMATTIINVAIPDSIVIEI